MKKASDKWYFTKETNAKGLCYIYAYQTQWDPVTKKSKRSARKYVGRLAADSVVNITAKFRTEFPQYAQGTFYFGLDKTLVDEAAYRHGGLAGQCVFAAWSCSEEPAHQRSIEPSYA